MLLLLACLTPERYTDDLATARCETYERCSVLGVLGYDGLEHCLELSAGLEVPDCESFDGGAARECADGWASIECDALDQHPQACFETCPQPAEDTGEE